MRTYLDDRAVQVRIDRDLGHRRQRRVRDEEVARARAELAPARRCLALDGDCTAARAVRAVGEVEDVKADAGVRDDEGVRAGDERHAERQGATGRWCDRREVFRERAVGGDVPDGEEADCWRRALDCGDELGLVRTEDDLAGGACKQSQYDQTGT